jgi:hypothetical protein
MLLLEFIDAAVSQRSHENDVDDQKWDKDDV